MLLTRRVPTARRRWSNRQPDNPLYHHDLAVSYFNAGSMLERLQNSTGARVEYEKSLPSAQESSGTGQKMGKPADAI